MNTLHKAERLNSKIIIDKMFTGGVSHSFSIYPLRVVFMSVGEREMPVSILISVPKKRFKRAVKRNRVKRQIREAYRKNKGGLLNLLEKKKQGLAISFIYLSDRLIPSAEIEDKIKILLARIAEKQE